MAVSRAKWLVIPVLAALLTSCASESLAGLRVNEKQFTGSYLAPSDAFTAGAQAASLVPTAAASQVYSAEDIKKLANATIQVADDWVGPICKKYAVYFKFFNEHIDFNSGDEGFTTGGKFSIQAAAMVQAMVPLAKNKEQKEWAAYAAKLFDSVKSGNPTKWDAGSPVDDVDWLAQGWTVDPDYWPNQPALELATRQAAMAACLKLK
jgi:hypothetical protein